MKQILSAAAIFLMSLSSNISSAQTNKDISLVLSGITATGAYLSNYSEAKAADVNIRAMRDFSRAYKNAPAAKWFKSATGYYASFDKDGNNTRIVYDNRGNRSYTIISYAATKLDRSIRSAVMSTYYDATIVGVHQFEFDRKTVHVIKMMDQSSHPFTLKVCDGQIEDITSHGKK